MVGILFVFVCFIYLLLKNYIVNICFYIMNIGICYIMIYYYILYILCFKLCFLFFLIKMYLYKWMYYVYM